MTATETKMENIFASDLRCMKKVKTRNDFTLAINSAVATVNFPKFIPATATVSAVNTINDSQTKM